MYDDKEAKRFEIVFKENTFATVTRILKDRDTGVCYLYYANGNAGGLSVMLDKDGKPVTM